MDICSRCGYLLIFRNYNGNDHHPLHLPSGWHCWAAGKSPGAPPAHPVPFPDGGTRSEEYWEDLKKRGIDMYHAFRKTSRMEKLLSLVRNEIEAGNDRMVGNLLDELLYRFPASPDQASFLRQIVASDSWQKLRERAEAG